MADNDVKIKLSLDGDKLVIDGLKGVGDGASSADSKLGSFVSGGLKGAGVALAGLAAAGVAAGAALSGAVISSYADYEQNLGGIETMFGDSTAKMVGFADEAYKSAGLSANEYMSQVTSFSASLLQGLEGDTDKAAEAANLAMIDMSDNANKFGSNIGDIQNAYQGFAKQNFTMLDNLKLGYGGTKEEMQRLMDDASKLPAAMGKEFDLNNFADVTEAIHLIQDEMGIAGTTALEASETISGSIGMLKGSFDNLLTGLGDADADVATLAGNVITSLETVVSNVGPVIENLGANMELLGPQIGTLLEGLVGTVSSAIPGLLQAGVSMIGGLIQGISSALPKLIEALVPGLIGLVEMVVTQLPLLIDAGLQAVAALAQGVAEALPTLIPLLVQGLVDLTQAIIDNLPLLLEAGLQLVTGLASGLLAAIPVLIEALPTLIVSLVEFLVGAIPMIREAGIELLMGLIGALPEIIEGLVAAIPLIITGLLDAVIGALPAIIQGGIDLFLSLIKALPTIIVGIVQAIPQIISAVLGAVTGAIPQLVLAGVQLLVSLVKNLPSIIVEVVKAIPQIIGGIVGALGSSVGEMAKAGGDLVAGLWSGITGSADWLWDKVKGWLGGLMSNIKDFFGIKSPSRKMRDEVGEMLPAGVGAGIEENEDAALEPMEDLNQKLTREAKKITGLKLDASVNLSGGQAQQSSSMQASSAYSPGNVSVMQPTIIVDASSIGDAFEQWLSSGAGQTQVQVDNTINMYDRDPRIVGRQIGREIEGELVG